MLAVCFFSEIVHLFKMNVVPLHSSFMIFSWKSFTFYFAKILSDIDFNHLYFVFIQFIFIMFYHTYFMGSFGDNMEKAQIPIPKNPRFLTPIIKLSRFQHSIEFPIYISSQNTFQWSMRCHVICILLCLVRWRRLNKWPTPDI